ncbi:thermonuclease family protein [Mycoplasma sp. Sp33II]|uniref:thermonuclease family protein n=1 Tax=unclassified Mycoplasma TaxID=2683645 RepID=UPI003AAB0D2A
MKKIWKSLILSSAPFAAILPMVAVSCGNDKDNNSGTNNNKATKISLNFKAFEGNLPKLEFNAKKKTFTYKPQIKTIEQSQNYIDQKASILSTLGGEVLNLLSKTIKYNPDAKGPEGTPAGKNFLLIPDYKFSDYKNLDLQITIDGNPFKLSFISMAPIIDKNSGPSAKYFKELLPEDQREALFKELKEIQTYQEIQYQLESLNKEDNKYYPVKDFTFSVRYQNAPSVFNPQLEKYPVQPKLSEMKALPDDFWTEDRKRTRFHAKVLKVADGDTCTVEALENNDFLGIKKGDRITIRYSGIDTPEKAVGTKIASPFEYGFALMSTHFGEAILNVRNNPQSEFNNFGDSIYVGFATAGGKDTFNRLTADIFFGENGKYSYNTEITRAGFTLPLADSAWESTIKNPESYAHLFYPAIAEALHEATVNERGFFNYFASANDIAKYVYIAKENNAYYPFLDLLNSNKNANK